MRPCLEKIKRKSIKYKELSSWPEKELSGVFVSHVQGSNKII